MDCLLSNEDNAVKTKALRDAFLEVNDYGHSKHGCYMAGLKDLQTVAEISKIVLFNVSRECLQRRENIHPTALRMSKVRSCPDWLEAIG